MSWLTSLFTDPSSFSHGMLVYSFVIALGLSLGRIRVFGISLGTTWVLFLGLILSFLGLKVDPALLGFF
ncbi:MAG: transporter, partial [Sutterellaceae bacterium]|nr:transporter [Sutterellaceae bacterium]